MATVGWTFFLSCEILPVIPDLLRRLEYAAKNVMELRKGENTDSCNSFTWINCFLLKDARNLKDKADSLLLTMQGILSPYTLIFITRRGHCRGRPKIHGDIDRVCTLREIGFSWSVISKLLGISRRTLYQ